jgi:hypothetical protein
MRTGSDVTEVTAFYSPFLSRWYEEEVNVEGETLVDHVKVGSGAVGWPSDSSSKGCSCSVTGKVRDSLGVRESRMVVYQRAPRRGEGAEGEGVMIVKWE